MKDVELNKTLEKILELISRDVNVIASNFVEIQLDSQSAQTLCRYASALSDIKQDKQKEIVKEKSELNKLSTEELIELYKSSKKE